MIVYVVVSYEDQNGEHSVVAVSASMEGAHGAALAERETIARTWSERFRSGGGGWRALSETAWSTGSQRVEIVSRSVVP